jgi:hypothetical protein
MKQYSQLEIVIEPTDANHVVRKAELDDVQDQIDAINMELNGVSQMLLTLENTVNGEI